ncbi:MAG: class I SAM-dependent methyltransferase [Candidatus Curtissbacteria bacterium]|nr:class I SAM-dependent methyltransferase [Candidatus Curtissbacteria bacterium]
MHLKILETSMGYDLSQKLLAHFFSKQSAQDLSKKLKRMSANSVLDVGCATAFYRDNIPVDHFVGIDVNKNFIESAKKRFPNDKFFVMDAVSLKFPDSAFDAVISKGVLHHLSETGLIKALKESLRVCRKNGQVIVWDAIQPTSRWNILGKFLRNLDQGQHIREQEQYKALLENNFVLDEFKIYSSFPYEACAYTISKSKN